MNQDKINPWGGNKDKDFPWEDPCEEGCIPQETKRWVAIAAAKLCDALSTRTDTPALFVDRVLESKKALEEAVEWLHKEFKPRKGNQ